MGQLADALRANLRELAQADARLLRELDAALPADELDDLSLKHLKERCKQAGLKGYSSLKKPELIQRLRAAQGGDQQGIARPRPLAMAAPSPMPPSASSNGLADVQARLDRLEDLLVRIATHLGVG